TGIASDTYGVGQGGDVTIRALGAIDLRNNSAISSSAAAAGDAGNIRINAQRLRIQRGGGVIANTILDGNGGNIRLDVDDSVEVLSSVPKADFPTSIVSANSFLGGGLFNIIGTGRGGNVTINTDRLIVRGGAVVSSSAGGFLNDNGTAPRGGRAGNLTINARRSIEVSGISEDEQFPSLINSTTATTGSAGVLTLNTRRLTVQGGGQVSVSTSGIGGGRGGRLEAFASDRIELSGQVTRRIRLQNNEIRPLTSSSGLTATAGFAFFRYPSNSRGGNLRIRTNELIVRNRAEVAVGSVEEGGANSGNISIRANTVQLRRFGRITAATNSGEGGNIRLNIGNLIMRRSGNISADATNSGNGGNIRINSNFIVGVPTENSDILTGAVSGNGGDINIRTQGIFGLVPRDPNPKLSDISADSKFGLDGVIEITTPDVDPSRSTVVLPSNLVDVSGLVAQDCRGQGAAIAQNSSAFTISGRGGIPPTPTDMFDGSSPYVDLETPPAPDSQSMTLVPTPAPAVSESSDRIIEAQGWVVASNGVVALTPDVPAAPATTGIQRPSCPTTF
ncbi:MAG TPA: S-layer family protein, partial [Crinalium sp.]